MRCVLILSIFLIIGICHGGEIAVHRSREALQRHTRAIQGSSFVMVLEAKIISDCKLNTHEEDITSKLQNIFQQTKNCLIRKMIFSKGKNEYLNSFDECTKEALQETIKCLPENHKYLPVLLKQYAKNMISLMYDDQHILLSDVAPCMRKFERTDVQKDYIQCVTDAEAQNGVSSAIPNSKKEFCRSFVPAHQCFPQMMKTYCVQSDGVKKFRKDYNSAGEQICEEP